MRPGGGGLGLTDFGLPIFWTPAGFAARPAQPAVAGRPVLHAGQGDPLLALRPEGGLVRRVRETERVLESARRAE